MAKTNENHLFGKVVATMEHQEFYTRLGANIRTFRKLQNMTQKDLAQRLRRSLACVSKYEKGGVAIDIFTVYEIAEALSVSPQILLPDEEILRRNDLPRHQLPGIFQQRNVYCYLYVGERRTVVMCRLEIQHDSSHVVVYVEPDDQRDSKSCRYLMTGDISCCETNVVVSATNPLVNGDMMQLCFSRISLIQGTNVGICTTVTPTYRFRATKCCLTAAPVADPQQLKDTLLLTKEELSYIRKNHSLLV